MTADEPPAAPETLLAHAAWMRRLARSLVKDDAQADDVVQDAVVAAMRAPPRDARALPAWLATTVRNGARQLWRGESRRAARESAGARPEATPSTVEVVTRAEEHGLVVQAVLALDEPYRSTLLLRFYDDLPPRDVAARTGVPVETARARIRRGLEQLRGRLDRAHGGDGAAWRLALAPLIIHKTAATAGAGTGAAAGHQLTTGAMVMAGTGAVAAVGAIALAVGVATGWWFGTTKSDSVAAGLKTSLDGETRQIESLSADLAARDARAKKSSDEFESKLRAAQKDAAEARKQVEGLTSELETAKAAAAKAPAPSALAVPVPSPKGPRFPFAEYAKLGEVDWNSVGEHLSALAPLCEEIAAAVAKGERPSPEAQGKAAQHNGGLIIAALKIAGQVPGSSINSSYAHPAFMVNAIAATLDAAKKPLTAEQATALERMAREMTDEDVKRLQAYPAGTYALQKTIDEVDLRKRFFDGAFAALTDEQRDALTPPSARGILGMDFFSESLAWLQFLAPVTFKDQNGLVEGVTQAVQNRLHVPAEQADALKSVVSKWVRDVPPALVDPTSEKRARAGVVQAQTVQAEAALTLKLVQSVVADLKLEGAPAEAARKWQALLLLLPGDE